MNFKKVLTLGLIAYSSLSLVHASEAIKSDLKISQADLTLPTVQKEHFMSIKFSPVPLIFGMIQLKSEFKVADHYTVGVGGYSWDLDTMFDEGSASGFNLDFTYYNQGRTQKGTFLRVTPTYGSFVVKDYLDLDMDTFAVDVIVGKRRQGELVGLDLGVGIQYSTVLSTNIKSDDERFNRDFKDLMKRALGFGLVITADLVVAF